MEIRANKLFSSAVLYRFCKSVSANTHSNDTIFVYTQQNLMDLCNLIGAL